MSFDIALILTIMCTMYIAWYAGKAPSGVNTSLHVLASIGTLWLAIFFAYYMVVELPFRPRYHTALIFIWYCATALTYFVLCERGRNEVRNELRGNKSR